jgi:pimeloyl-ACP methyl ester carboxylesterase
MAMTTGRPVSYFQDDGYEISADLYANSDNPTFGVVFCHGWGGTKNIVAPVLAGEIVKRTGAAALVFDYSGWGQSEGPRGRLDPWREVRDIRASVSFMLTEMPELAGHIGIYGFSFGGAIATYAAATDDRVNSLVAIASFLDGDSWMQDLRPWWQYKQFAAKITSDRLQRARSGKSEEVDPDWILPRDPEAKAFNEDLRSHYPERNFMLDIVSAELICSFNVAHVAPRLAGRPSLFIHCAEDLLNPPRYSLELARLAGGEAYIVPDLGHYDIYAGAGLDVVSSLASSHLSGLGRQVDPETSAT